MMKSTRDAVAAICNADPSINAAQLKAGLAELGGEGTKSITGEPPKRSYTARQVAALLGKSTRMVREYCKMGFLVPIRAGAGGVKVTAYTGESVERFLSGRATAKKSA